MSETLLKTTNNSLQIKIPIQTKDGYHFIKIHDIIRFEASGRNSLCFLSNSYVIKSQTSLKRIEEMMNKYCFIRIHHAHLININSVKEIKLGQTSKVILDNGTSIDIAQRKKKRSN